MTRPHKPILLALDMRDAKSWCYERNLSWSQDVIIVTRPDQLRGVLVHEGQVSRTDRFHENRLWAEIEYELTGRMERTASLPGGGND